jgi:precorrin-2 dehydrogenase/sirohydrochlorin ferrochelatase
MKSYFPAALNVHGRACLVIGEGRDANDKAAKLKKAGAKLRVIGLKQFKLSDLKNQFFVVFCPKDEPLLAKKVALICRTSRTLLCAIDQPEYCDVVNVSTYDRGLLRIMAATQGAAPAISRKIREGLEESLKNVPLEGFLDNLARLRGRLKKEISDPDERIQRLIKATDGFSFRAKVTLPRNWRRRNS